MNNTLKKISRHFALAAVALLIIILSAGSVMAASDSWTPDTSWYDDYKNERGSVDNPFLISTPEELAGLAKMVNVPSGQWGVTKVSLKDKHILLTRDINLEDREWAPIGWYLSYTTTSGWTQTREYEGFDGSFNGGGHTISGLKIETCENVPLYNSKQTEAAGLFGYISIDGKIRNLVVKGKVNASECEGVGGIAGWADGLIENCVTDVEVRATSSKRGYAGGIAGYSDSGKITNNAHSGGNVSVSGGHDNNYAGGIAGYNDGTGTITNSCWLASGNLEAIGGGIAVSADVVSLDAAVMEKVVTTVLPAKRTLSVEVGGSAPALISYPGTADDMAGYLSVSGDIFIASPDIADISRGWPCAVSGIKPGVTAVSFDIDLRATDFSDKNNLKPLSAGCATGPLCFTAAVGKVPVSGVSLDFTELALDIGESKKLTATVKPDNATDKEVAWTSANPAVAAVDDMGKVTALSAGTTVITAKAGGVSAACTVTVAHKKTGGSGHGCAAGLGAFPMLALIPLWLRRKKR